MARKDKPIKIKRYKNSMGTGTNTVYKVKRVVPIVAGVVVLVLAGFLLGKPLLAMLSGGGVDTDSKPQTSSQTVTSTQTNSEVPPTSETTVSSQEDTSSKTEVVPPVVKTKAYYYVDTATMSTDAGLAAVIDKAKAAGATHLVFDVKNPDGTVMYLSSNEYASKLASDKAVDLKVVAEKVSASGLVPVARMYTFMDKLISNVERSTAVMYQGTDTRWLDSSAALGGKPWANPANHTMQDYINALTDEVLSMGVKEFIFAGYHTPTGYSLDKRDFGVTQDQLLGEMKHLLNVLMTKISAKGGAMSLQIEYSAVMPEGNYAHYIVHPYQFGVDNVIITAKGADINVEQAVAQLSASINGQSRDITKAVLWLTDNLPDESVKQLGDHFVA